MKCHDVLQVDIKPTMSAVMQLARMLQAEVESLCVNIDVNSNHTE